MSRLAPWRAYGGLSITFDLSGYVLNPTQDVFGTINVPSAGVVTGVDWDLTYQAGGSVGSGSWASELSIELVGPGATANNVISTGSGSPPGGFHPETPGNAGTFIWGSPDPWSAGFNPGGDSNSFNFGWPDSSSDVVSSAGSTTALDGWSAEGDWTVNLFDSFNDTADGNPAQGTFMSGSTITIHYSAIPAPGALALLGMAGLVGTRRRRN